MSHPPTHPHDEVVLNRDRGLVRSYTSPWADSACDLFSLYHVVYIISRLYVMTGQHVEPGLAAHLNFDPVTGECVNAEEMCVIVSIRED